MAKSKSSFNALIFWPGKAYIKSIFTRSNTSLAAFTAALASTPECIRPSDFKKWSLKLCTPILNLVTPAFRNSLNLLISEEPGLASIVISKFFSQLTIDFIEQTSLSIKILGVREGVPPPIKILFIALPFRSSNEFDRSRMRQSI